MRAEYHELKLEGISGIVNEGLSFIESLLQKRYGMTRAERKQQRLDRRRARRQFIIDRYIAKGQEVPKEFLDPID